jgi:hypothetical protein
VPACPPASWPACPSSPSSSLCRRARRRPAPCGAAAVGRGAPAAAAAEAWVCSPGARGGRHQPTGVQRGGLLPRLLRPSGPSSRGRWRHQAAARRAPARRGRCGLAGGPPGQLGARSSSAAAPAIQPCTAGIRARSSRPAQCDGRKYPRNKRFSHLESEVPSQQVPGVSGAGGWQELTGAPRAHFQIDGPRTVALRK